MWTATRNLVGWLWRLCFRGLVPRWPGDVVGQLRAATESGAWYVAWSDGDLAAAETHARGWVDLLERHAPDSPSLPLARRQLASTLREQGRVQEAFEALPADVARGERWAWLAQSAVTASNTAAARTAAALGLADPATTGLALFVVGAVAARTSVDDASGDALLAAALERATGADACRLWYVRAAHARLHDRALDALRGAEAALTHEHDLTSQAHQLRGDVLHDLGRHREAAEAYALGGERCAGSLGHQRIAHLGDPEGALEPLAAGIARCSAGFEQRAREVELRSRRCSALLALDRPGEALEEAVTARARLLEAPPQPERDRWYPTATELSGGIPPGLVQEAAATPRAHHLPLLRTLEGRALLALGRVAEGRATLADAVAEANRSILVEPTDEPIARTALSAAVWSACGACRAGDAAARASWRDRVVRDDPDGRWLGALDRCSGAAACGVHAEHILRIRTPDADPTEAELGV